VKIPSRMQTAWRSYFHQPDAEVQPSKYSGNHLNAIAVSCRLTAQLVMGSYTLT
jgi:hypothetical protein